MAARKNRRGGVGVDRGRRARPNNENVEQCENIKIACGALLQACGVSFGDTEWYQVEHHMELIREWNSYASLVSRGDLPNLVKAHVIDSLSLVPIVLRFCGDAGQVLDIGSGGGFPAIPLKTALPDLEMVLVERSERAVVFLRKSLGTLGLRRMTVVQGEFPQCVREARPTVITARAVDRPKKVLRAMRGFLERGSVFLCQSGDPREDLSRVFHVEQVEDAWTKQGLRRGRLFLVGLPQLFHVER